MHSNDHVCSMATQHESTSLIYYQANKLTPQNMYITWLHLYEAWIQQK